MSAHVSRASIRGRTQVILLAVASLLALILIGWLIVGLSSRSASPSRAALAEAKSGATPEATSTRETPHESNSARVLQTTTETADASANATIVETVAATNDALAAPTSLEQKLDRVAATFLSKDPDIAGMRNIAIQCAQKAVVDEKSVRTDVDGIRHGKFAIAGTTLKGTFQIEGDSYEIDLTMRPPAEAGPGFVQGDLSIRANDNVDQVGGAGLGVQFHPNYDKAKQIMSAEDGEKIVGWSLAQGPNGFTSMPITMRLPPNGPGMIIGRSESMSTVSMDGDSDLRANDAWLAKLRGFKSSTSK